jgi:hypothetical protein
MFCGGLPDSEHSIVGKCNKAGAVQCSIGDWRYASLLRHAWLAFQLARTNSHQIMCEQGL